MSPHALLIATAGHVDHGKSTLVRILTGTDPDRWAEEKRRGITLDLGYAHMAYQGRTYAFVDVPGHEKFIQNMLAGVGALDAVLLVVAADASIMPQTREHARALAYLGVTQIGVVLSKVDLIDPDLLDLLREEVAAFLDAFGWPDAPVVGFSEKQPETWEGVRALLAGFSPQKVHEGEGFRLSIDRVFTQKGSGTVVTGTVERGRLRREDAVYLYPVCAETRIRQIQVHGKAVDSVGCHDRVALNLGDVHYRDLARGHLVFGAARGLACRKILVRLMRFEEDWAPGPRHTFHIHHLAAHIQGRLVWMQEGFALLALVKPYPFWALDRALIRDGSPLRVIAGFEVVDPHPVQTKWRNLGSKVALYPENVRDVPAWQAWFLASAPGLMRVKDVEDRCGEPLPPSLQADLVLLPGGQMLRKPVWVQWNEALITTLKAVHRKYALYERVPLSVFQAQVRALGGSNQLIEALLAQAVAEGRILIRGDRVKLAVHRVSWRAEDRAKLQLFLEPLQKDLGLVEVKEKDETLRAIKRMLCWEKYLVELREDLLVGHQTLNQWVTLMHRLYEGKRFSIPELKETLQLSRKVAVPLVEYLDKIGCTRREADERIWIAREAPLLESEWHPPER